MRTPRLLGPWLLLPFGVAAAVAAVVADQLRAGGYLLAATLGAVALLRVVLPARAAGALVVRSRPADVLMLVCVAFAAAALAATIKLIA
ncbi:DUF3017 domain-containing protein [Angustibacter sp. McL0619]|uniref:DUF3017 domain-containing protein n=1 Tax=Angustibacter sp. McL0619 TaxID=3415676 RepID=UPI003CEC2C30